MGSFANLPQCDQKGIAIPFWNTSGGCSYRTACRWRMVCTGKYKQSRSEKGNSTGRPSVRRMTFPTLSLSRGAKAPWAGKVVRKTHAGVFLTVLLFHISSHERRNMAPGGNLSDAAKEMGPAEHVSPHGKIKRTHHRGDPNRVEKRHPPARMPFCIRFRSGSPPCPE